MFLISYYYDAYLFPVAQQTQGSSGTTINLTFGEGAERVSEANAKYGVTNLVSGLFPAGTHDINVRLDGSIDAAMQVPGKGTILVNPGWLQSRSLNVVGSALGHELNHVNDFIRGNINTRSLPSVNASEFRAYSWQFSTRSHFGLSPQYKGFLLDQTQTYSK